MLCQGAHICLTDQQPMLTLPTGKQAPPHPGLHAPAGQPHGTGNLTRWARLCRRPRIGGARSARTALMLTRRPRGEGRAMSHPLLIQLFTDETENPTACAASRTRTRSSGASWPRAAASSERENRSIWLPWSLK